VLIGISTLCLSRELHENNEIEINKEIMSLLNRFIDLELKCFSNIENLFLIRETSKILAPQRASQTNS
jgi:hypothetical protein